MQLAHSLNHFSLSLMEKKQQHYPNLISAKTTTTNKVKLLLSYGGKIQPRPSDHQLCYQGGDTKILALDRNVKFSEVVSKLKTILLCSNTKDDHAVLSISVKYQLPGLDLDALISSTDDDDVEHMMAEYDRMQRINDDRRRPASSRLRLFVFDNSVPKQAPSPSPNPDYLFGFDKEYTNQTTNAAMMINGPPLDLLQIPGMFVPEGGHVSGNGCTADVASMGSHPAIYTVVGNGQYAIGDGEQPVYGAFVPVSVMPAKQQGMVVGNNSNNNYVNLVGVEGKVGQNNC